MLNEEKKSIGCDLFEDRLSDFLEGEVQKNERTLLNEHALQCPLCHALMNEVKDAMGICRELGAPVARLTGLEAKIIEATVPESAMNCDDFEEYLTDYLDGFLPAKVFHRWERHAVLCEDCTDLPGEVVRSIAACYTYKIDELEVPDGLNAKILESTIGTSNAKEVRPSIGTQLGEWVRGLSLPISTPQLAPVAMMLLFAFLVFSQTTSATIGGVYQKGFEMAERTYQQGADVVLKSQGGEDS